MKYNFVIILTLLVCFLSGCSDNNVFIESYAFHSSSGPLQCDLTRNDLEYHIKTICLEDDKIYENDISTDTYIHLKEIIDKFKRNPDTFDKFSSLYCRLNVFDTTGDYLISSLILNLSNNNLQQSELLFEEIDYIEEMIDDEVEILNGVVVSPGYDHIYKTDNYLIYSNIHSSLNQKGATGLTKYFSDMDKEPRLVNYDTFKNIWQYYTNGSEIPYSDTSLNYLVYANLGFYTNVDVWVEGINIDKNLDMSIGYSYNGVSADGTGSLLVVPVEETLSIGDIVVFSDHNQGD